MFSSFSAYIDFDGVKVGYSEGWYMRVLQRNKPIGMGVFVYLFKNKYASYHYGD